MIWKLLLFIFIENGGWGAWLKWSPCSVSCGEGIRRAHRYCDSPIPKYGGAKCAGDSFKEESCNNGPCPSKFFCNAILRLIFFGTFSSNESAYRADPKNLTSLD